MTSQPAPPRPRVLWLIKALAAGGAERLLVTAARLRDVEAFDVDVAYVVPGLDDLVAPLEATGIRVRQLGGGLAWPARLRAMLLADRYDVVHVHSPSVAVALRAVVRSMPSARRPLVVSTEHCTWQACRPLTRVLNGLTCANDAARFAVSARVVASMWPRRRGDVDVLMHGVVLADFRRGAEIRSAVRRELGVAPHEVAVISVANYREGKGHDDLLAVARRVADAAPHVRFLALGQGPLEQSVRNAASALGLGGRVRFLGYREDVPRVLVGCDLFLVTSHDEGGPLAAVEALAAGLPVVATDVGFMSDLLSGGSGTVLPVGDVSRLADAVLALAHDPAARDRASTVAQEQRDALDGQRAVDVVEAAYRRLVEGRQRRVDA